MYCSAQVKAAESVYGYLYIIHSTIKCTREIDTFSNTGPHTIPYMLSRS